MVGRARGFGELTLLVHVHAWAFREPEQCGERPLARPELEHLAAAPQRLAHRIASIDELASHGFGTSTDPSGRSRTVQPRSSIRARLSSAVAKSRAALAAS